MHARKISDPSDNKVLYHISYHNAVYTFLFHILASILGKFLNENKSQICMVPTNL